MFSTEWESLEYLGNKGISVRVVLPTWYEGEYVKILNDFVLE